MRKAQFQTPVDIDNCVRSKKMIQSFLRFIHTERKRRRIFFPLSLLNVNIKFCSLRTHLEVMSLSLQYKRTLSFTSMQKASSFKLFQSIAQKKILGEERLFNERENILIINVYPKHCRIFPRD